MNFNATNTKYEIDITTNFKRNYKKIKKQGKNIEKLKELVVKFANKEKLDFKYEDERLLLLLVATGSHS